MVLGAVVAGECVTAPTHQYCDCQVWDFNAVHVVVSTAWTYMYVCLTKARLILAMIWALLWGKKSPRREMLV